MSGAAWIGVGGGVDRGGSAGLREVLELGVKRGEIIALSGNTGNSSTPHLHFDVRENWALEYPGTMLEYPSVRVTFQDHDHATWIPRVGDTLKSNNS